MSEVLCDSCHQPIKERRFQITQMVQMLKTNGPMTRQQIAGALSVDFSRTADLLKEARQVLKIDIRRGLRDGEWFWGIPKVIEEKTA